MCFEDSALIKLFFSVQWSNDKQMQLVAVIGGQWWWRRRLGVLRDGLGEEDGDKMFVLCC